jgi:hypothetical protein
LGHSYFGESHVLKQAFAAKILRDGQLWIDMLRCRNLMSHTCDAAVSDQAVRKMPARLLPALVELHGYLMARGES